MPEQWNKYAPTAARRHGRPGREQRPKGVTIDIHSHVAVPAAAKFVEPYLDWATIPLAHFADAQTRALSQKQEADIRARVGHDHRLADLDAMGIDVQIIAPPPPQCYYTVPIEIAVKATQIVNDGIAEFCAVKPERLKGFGAVPMTDGAEATRELERCIRKLGFTGVEILTNVAGKELSDPAFAPFWQKAEELGALVMIHPNGFTDAARLTRFYFNNVIGNPLETTIALHYLIFDGVLERHPRLKMLAVHGGGYLGAPAASTMPGVRVPIVTARCPIRLRLISSESMSIRSYSRRTNSPHWSECSAPTMSCLEPITPMTWRSMIRSAISPPLRISMPRRSRRWPEAMPRSFSSCSRAVGSRVVPQSSLRAQCSRLPRAEQMRCRRR
jgi:aminocarboxymuconate-semialdehyde decarboxylase